MSAAPIACVTGAATGIGRATALKLAGDGFHVFVSDLDEARVTSVADEIGAAGGRATALGCDVTDEVQVAELFAAVATPTGHLDALVVNAGIYPPENFATMTLADYDRIMAVNVRGAVACTLEAVPLLDGGASVVFVSSGVGTIATARNPLAGNMPLYGVSKAALDRWAIGIVVELAPRDVAVNVIWPGAVVRTEGTQAMGLADAQLAGGVEPDFVAPAITWLARQRASTFTGHRVTAVDFGTTWGPGVPVPDEPMG